MFGMWTKTPVSDYQVPSLDQLTELCKEVKQEYERLNEPTHLPLLRLLRDSLVRIKTAKIMNAVPLTTAEFNQLALAEWLLLIEMLHNTVWLKSRLLNNITDKFVTKFKFDPHQLNSVQKLLNLNLLYHFKFESQKGAYSELFQLHQAIASEKETEMLKIMATIYTPVKKNQHEFLHCLSSESTLDIFFSNFYKMYCNETKYDNPEHRLLARITQSLIKLNPIEDDEPHFLSMSHRLKLGWLSFLIDSIKNSKFVYRWLSKFWDADHSAIHRIANQGLLDNYAHIPPEIKHEALCTIKRYLETFDAVKELEKAVNNRDTFPKEAPVYMNSQLDPIIDEIRDMVRSIAPKKVPAISEVAFDFAKIGAVVGGIPGIACGIALGFGAGLTDQAEILKGTFKGTTGFAMKCILGNGGAILGHYGSEIFVNEALKLALGALVGSFCAAVGAATGLTVGIMVLDVSPKTLTMLKSAYRSFCNHPEIRPILNQNLFKDLDPDLVRCLETLPRPILDEEKYTKLLRLKGDEKAVKSMFDKKDSQPKIDIPTAPNLVLSRSPG